jgi:hypothetical protein
MAVSNFDPHAADVNRRDRRRDGDLLSVDALKHAHTLACEIEELEHNRQYLLGGHARGRVRLSIVGAPGPSYEMPGRGVIDLQRATLVALLEDEITERQQKLIEMGAEPPTIAPRPANWTKNAEPNAFDVAVSQNTMTSPDWCPPWP